MQRSRAESRGRLWRTRSYHSATGASAGFGRSAHTDASLAHHHLNDGAAHIMADDTAWPTTPHGRRHRDARQAERIEQRQTIGCASHIPRTA
jgi:hypothetical protein